MRSTETPPNFKGKGKEHLIILSKHTSVIEFQAIAAFSLVPQWHHRNNKLFLTIYIYKGWCVTR